MSKKLIKQVGMVYIDNRNLWAGLEDEDNLLLAIQRGQGGVDIWGGSLQAVGGTLQPPKCTWTAHDMVQDKKREWVYRDAPKIKTKGDKEADEEGRMTNWMT